MGEVKYYGRSEGAGIEEAHHEAVHQITEDDLCA